MKKEPGRLSNEQPRSDSAKCALPHETALLRENNQHEIGFPEVRPKPAILILLMANHPIHRKGIRLILEDQDAMEIAGEISSVEELRRYQAPFDIVIFEPDSGNPDRAEMVAEVVLEAAQSRVIVLLPVFES